VCSCDEAVELRRRLQELADKEAALDAAISELERLLRDAGVSEPHRRL
jgi:hypothetical protein